VYLSEKSVRTSAASSAAFRAAICVALAFSGLAPGQVVEPPPVPGSLKNIPIPEPSDLSTYVRDKAAAIRLGKALFWDMQLGSDNQACASCHFHAGADDRAAGQLDPGLRSVTPDDTYQLGGPNFQLQPSHFPFHKLQDPENRHSTVLADTNDVASSQGTYFTQFSHVNPGQTRDAGTPLPDPDFSVRGVNVRRVPPRNTPSVINAVFNVHNFWDGRASYYFNGNNPFGALDMNSGIFVDAGGTLHKQIVRIEKSSLASQAVGPPLSEMEMSFLGRTWPDVGKKMLTLTPLALQIVHPSDSVLGPLSKATKPGLKLKGPGLKTDYPSMIKAAFWDQYWSSNNTIVRFVNGQPVFSPRPGGALQLTEYTQMEANFAFFFGLAIQAYESTLVSDDSPWDRHATNPSAYPLTTKQALGLGVFLSAGKSPFEREQGACVNCHAGAEFTNASHSFRGNPANRIEIMLMGNGGTAFYDGGWYNTGLRPVPEDTGRVGDSPFTNPLTGRPFPLSEARLALLARSGLLPAAVAPYVAPLPFGAPFPDPSRTAMTGVFKTPSLRNVELTGPYFHNGGQATLRQVVDFYDRGGDFPEANVNDIHFDITELFLTDQQKDDLVEFLLMLTDERVRKETAPFDHPQLFLPNGSRQQGGAIVGDFNLIRPGGFRDTELVRELPAVGSQGLPAEGLPPIQTFLGLDPHAASTGP
jgi:cytochrome c peroxidase